jgi:hypothetical protein
LSPPPPPSSSISSSSYPSIYVCLLVLNISFKSLMLTTTKIFLVTQKIKFSSKLVDRATQYGSTNSSSWNISSLVVTLSLPSWTTWTRPLNLVFTMDNQSILKWYFLKKKSVYVVNLLVFFGEKKASLTLWSVVILLILTNHGENLH